MRVIPVHTWVGELDAVGEAAADGDRRLCLVGAVVAVLDADAVPVHRRLQVAVVRDVHDHFRALTHLQRRAWDRAVVGQHPDRRLADPLRHGCYAQIERVAVGELDDLGLRRAGKPGDLTREEVGVRLGAHEVTCAEAISDAVSVASAYAYG